MRQWYSEKILKIRVAEVDIQTEQTGLLRKEKVRKSQHNKLGHLRKWSEEDRPEEIKSKCICRIWDKNSDNDKYIIN